VNWGERRTLLGRRRSTTVNFSHAFSPRDPGFKYHLTAGFYPDGTLGECFINTTKISVPLEALARDAAVAISIALQYGAPINVLRDAMTKGADGKHPSSPMGAVCNILAGLTDTKGEGS
jgi:hypothetical protein